MAVLKGKSGVIEGKEFSIDAAETTIGRALDNVIAISGERSISGYHCCIKKEGDRFLIKDLDSTNGTKLNDAPISESKLKNGDILQIGALEASIEGIQSGIVPSPIVAKTAPASIADRGGAAAVSDKTPEAEEKPAEPVRPEPGPSPFGAKRSRKNTWKCLMVGVGLAALLALSWLVYRLFFS